MTKTETYSEVEETHALWFEDSYVEISRNENGHYAVNVRDRQHELLVSFEAATFARIAEFFQRFHESRPESD